ncbi:hypothetical protein NQZ68_034616 [Dissostichus eleginoides]|nr:hypothetical protein NQZ68_034616 [Dissostichus eleginoides]
MIRDNGHPQKFSVQRSNVSNGDRFNFSFIHMEDFYSIIIVLVDLLKFAPNIQIAFLHYVVHFETFLYEAHKLVYRYLLRNSKLTHRLGNHGQPERRDLLRLQAGAKNADTGRGKQQQRAVFRRLF